MINRFASKDYPIIPNIDLDYQLSLIEEFEMMEMDREYQKLKAID